MPISKSDINELRLSLIRDKVQSQNKTLISLRDRLFPDVTENAFRQWFKPYNDKYWISDSKLCVMERDLGIDREVIINHIRNRLTGSPPSDEILKGMLHGITFPHSKRSLQESK